MDVIFDVDGTLLDISHRLHWLGLSESTTPSERANPSNSKNWKEFRKPELKVHDFPIKPVVTVMNSLYRDGHRILIVSGRIESEEEDTIKSLSILSPYVRSLPTYFRSDTDYRPDYEMKKTALMKIKRDGYDPVLAFDDRPNVIKMWKEHGILVADVGKGVDF